MAEEDETGQGDYWLDRPDAPAGDGQSGPLGAGPRLSLLHVTPHVQVIGDRPDGVLPAELVPWLPMPGKPSSSDAPLSGAPLADDRAPGARSYAILDAALIPNLPEMLETSGLPHRCLFRVEDAPELAQTAPWLVALQGEGRLLRGLFTRGKAPQHLWDRHAAIFLTSQAELSDLWQMLRRFTRVRDQHGRWYYWRFWDARALYSFLAEADFSPMAQQFLAGLQKLSPRTVLLLPQGDRVGVIELDRAKGAEAATIAPLLTDRDRQRLREELRRRDAAKLAGFLATQPVLGKSEPAYLDDLALRALIRRDEMDVRSPNGTAWLVILLYLADRHARAARALSALAQSRKWSFDQVARMLKHGADRARDKAKSQARSPDKGDR